MAVRRHAEHKLIERDASGVPSGDGGNSRAILVSGRCTGVVERSVRADGRRPRAPDVIAEGKHPSVWFDGSSHTEAHFMMAMWSSTFANPDTSFEESPLASAHGKSGAAAER
jgi:hypothetical protein